MSTATNARRPIRTMIARHPIGAFLAILYPLVWLFNLPALLGKSGFGIIPVDIPAQAGILPSTLLLLTGGAFLVTRIADGQQGVRALWRHFHQFRAGVQWYLLAILGAPAIMLSIAIIEGGSAALAPVQHNLAQAVSLYLVPVLITFVLINLWEEGGWMGFVTARLQRRWGPVLASVVVAPLFGFVHFPLLFIAGGLMNGKPLPSQYVEYAFYLVVLLSVPTRIVLTWVYNSTGGSLPVVGLMHASFDMTGSAAVLNTFFPSVNDDRLMFLGLAVIGLAAIVATRGRLGYRAPEQSDQAAPRAQVARVAS